MIVSLRKVTYEELKEQLTESKHIGIWTCNLCIKLCGLGGEDVAQSLAQKLQSDNYRIDHIETLGYACHMGYIRDRTRNPMTKPTFEILDTLIVLTCTDGFEKVERVFGKKKKIIQITETVGIGGYSSEKGMRLVNPYPELHLKADIEGIPLSVVAKKTGLYDKPM
jgi:hypothetical protein